MTSNTCRHCYHRNNCGAAASGYSCNSFLSAGCMESDRVERSKMKNELNEYTEAYREYVDDYADDCDF